MDYTQRIMKVVDYIESYLSQGICIADISNQVYTAPYHLQSIFAMSTGGTLGEYVKKRRLTEAAKKLVDTKLPIIDIALEYGYNSQEAFTRAFKSHFSMTPAKYRKRKEHVLFYYRNPIREVDIQYFQINVEGLKPRIIRKEAVKLVGIGRNTSYEESKTDTTWQDFYKKIHTIKAPEESGYFCVCIYDPQLQIQDISVNFKYRIFFGVAVDSFKGIPKGFETYILPEGDYALFLCKANQAVGWELYRYIFGEWLPKSGYRVNGNFDFEYYPKVYNPERMEAAIHIPILSP